MNNKTDLTSHSLGLLQGKAYSSLHESLTNVLSPFNLSIPEWKLLGQLYDHGSVRVSELSELLSYDPPMVTKLTKSLDKKNSIKREYDKTDERVKIITITSNGSNLLRKIEPVVKKKMAEILKGITREELNTYIKVLTVIVSNTQ